MNTQTQPETKTNTLVRKNDKLCKHSIVYEPAPGTDPAAVIASSVYVKKSALPQDYTGPIRLTLEIGR